MLRRRFQKTFINTLEKYGILTWEQLEERIYPHDDALSYDSRRKNCQNWFKGTPSPGPQSIKLVADRVGFSDAETSSLLRLRQIESSAQSSLVLTRSRLLSFFLGFVVIVVIAFAAFSVFSFTSASKLEQCQGVFTATRKSEEIGEWQRVVTYCETAWDYEEAPEALFIIGLSRIRISNIYEESGLMRSSQESVLSAFSAFAIAVGRGHGPSAMELARLMEQGFGVAKGETKESILHLTLHLYEMAASRGLPQGKFCLAMNFLSLDPPGNLERAKKLIEESARDNFAMAIIYLSSKIFPKPVDGPCWT